MGTTVATSGARCQADVVRHAGGVEGESVSLALRRLRAAIDASGWKHTAIASSIGVSPKYFSRMLAGEKVWTVKHLIALPPDIEARFVTLYAESLGLIVVQRVDAATAELHLASGLFNLLARHHATAADVPKARMAKAAL